MPAKARKKERKKSSQKKKRESQNEKKTHAIPNNRRDRRRVRAEALCLLHVGRVQVLRAVREEVEACGGGEG
jgi:hypothetical protein